MVANTESVKITSPHTGETRKFASDIIWFTVAQLFVSVILGMITLPALTKSYTSEIYGVWIQVNVTVDLISPLLSLQLGLSAVRFLSGEENRAIRRQSLGAMLLAIIGFIAIVSIAGTLFSKQLSAILFNSTTYVTYISLLVIWTVFNALFNFFIAYLRARRKVREVSIIQVAITLMKMVAILVLANAASSLELIIISMIALQIAFALYIFVMIIREVGFPLPNLTGLRTLLAFSVPQMPVIVLLWIISLGDRYFITHFLGLSQNGIYSPSSILAGLTALFYAPISFVLFPLISKLWRQERSKDLKSYFENSIKFFLTLAIPGAVGITILSQPLLKILTTSEFLAGEQIVLLLTIGAIFLGIYHINSNLIMLEKQAKFLPVMTAIAAITNVIMNILLVPRIGILGAAVSNCASYLVLAAIATIWARKTIRYSYDWKYVGKVVASTVAMVSCLLFLRVDSVWEIILAIVIGAVVLGAGLFILRALSKNDLHVVRKTFRTLLSRGQA